jgi:hypothetical protein
VCEHHPPTVKFQGLFLLKIMDNELKHSKEPWKLGDINKAVIMKNDQRISVCEINDPYHKLNECRANASRIVACVNACKGIDNILLERFTVEDTLNEAYRNRALVGELTDALKAVIAHGFVCGNDVRLSMIAASGKALSKESLADAEKSEAAYQKAILAISKAETIEQSKTA